MNSDLRLTLWKLYVGDSSSSQTYLDYSNLTTVTEFSRSQTFPELIKTAYSKRSNGLLKDASVSGFLIDRLRTGLGWKDDILSLNREIFDIFENVDGIGEKTISETTVAACFLECFAPCDYASRSRLLEMMIKCNMAVPLTTRISLSPSHFFVNVGFLQYQPKLFKKMILCFRSDSINAMYEHHFLQRIFPGISVDEEVDDVRSTTIELINYQAQDNQEALHILNLNDSLKSQISLIDILAPYCSVLIFSVDLKDIKENGALNIDEDNRHLLIRYLEKLTFVVRNVNPSMKDSPKLLKFWENYNQLSNNRFYVDDILKQEKPIYARITNELRKNIEKLLEKNVASELSNLLELQLNILQAHLGLNSDAKIIENWQEHDRFIRDIQNILHSPNNSKEKMFPYSHCAQNHKMNETENIKRHNQSRITINPLELNAVLAEKSTELSRQGPSKIVKFACQRISSVTRMHIFEREIQAWKVYGDVYRLRQRIAELQMINKQKMTTDTSTMNEISTLTEKLDSIDWGPLDLWRELRLIKRLIRDHKHLTQSQRRNISQQYPLLADNSNLLNSITGLYAQIFYSGFTVDAIDGTLLEYDHQFMEDAFRPEICRQIQGVSEQKFFVISVLGTQSTGEFASMNRENIYCKYVLQGKSTLLNNLFGCDMPVSAGRTTRGENITCVHTNISDCSIDKVVVQDFEGLMTMDRGGSVFDKSICLYALATSDLVLLNTSRVIDAPTQELLKYVIFAYYHLGLQNYRKPKLTFVLRDMSSDNLVEFSNIITQIEQGIIAYFNKSSTSIQLKDILGEIKYMALSSALHRQDDMWKQTFFTLRDHIFDHVRAVSKNIPIDHQNWSNWIRACDHIWTHVRQNENLLDADSLSEMQLKEDMDKHLNSIIESTETIKGITTKVSGKIIDFFYKMDPLTSLEQFDKYMTDLMAVEFRQYEEEVSKDFDENFDQKQTNLLGSYENYKINILKKVIEQYGEDAITELKDYFEDGKINVYLNGQLKQITATIKEQARDRYALSPIMKESLFNQFWWKQLAILETYDQESDTKFDILQKINECYRIIVSNNHQNQPNNLGQLQDRNTPNLTEISIERCLMLPEPGFLDGFVVSNIVNPDFSKAKVTLSFIREYVIDFIEQNLKTQKMNWLKLNHSIRDAVVQLNRFIKNWTPDLVSTSGYTFSGDFYKAAHRHLYLTICDFYQTGKERKEQQRISSRSKHRTNLHAKFISFFEKIYADINSAEEIVENLENALIKYAVNKVKLNLDEDDLTEIISEYFSDIETPEKLFNICYRKTFLERDACETFKFMTDRVNYMENVWTENYGTGKELLCKEKLNQVLSAHYNSNGRLRRSTYDKLQATINQWFLDSSHRNGATGRSLVQHLKKEQDINRILIESITVYDSLESLFIDDVNFTRKHVEKLWNFAEQKEKIESRVNEFIDGLYSKIKDRTYGCDSKCPFCDVKCSKTANHTDDHYCHQHIVAGFSERFKTSDKKIAHWFCEGLNWTLRWSHPLDSSSQNLEFGDYLRKYHPKWKIQKASSPYPPVEQREMFLKLNTRIANHYDSERNEPSDWPECTSVARRNQDDPLELHEIIDNIFRPLNPARARNQPNLFSIIQKLFQ